MTTSSTDVGFRTPLCDLLEIEVPILQAAMGRTRGSTTTPALAAAVSNAGGLGSLGATGMEPEEIRDAIREIRSLTSRPFAIGLQLPVDLDADDVSREELRSVIKSEHPQHWQFVQSLFDKYELDSEIKTSSEYALTPGVIRQQIEVLLEERVPVMTAGLGDADWFIDRAREAGMRIIGLCGNVRHVERQKAAGVDVIIAQGYEAGGHTGTIANFPLIPQAVDVAFPTPVIAAGGIADGRGIAAALALGAQGVWCGTAFLFAEEANVPPAFREQLSNASSSDVIVSRTYTGKTSRIVGNVIVKDWKESGLEPLPMPMQLVLMDDFVAAAEAADRFDLAINPAGQIAGMLTKHEPAADIVARMVEETTDVLRRLGSL